MILARTFFPLMVTLVILTAWGSVSEAASLETELARTLNGIGELKPLGSPRSCSLIPAALTLASGVGVRRCAREAPGIPEDLCVERHSWTATRGHRQCTSALAQRPLFELLEVNSGTFIIRQNKCSSFEAPFIYLLVGETGAFLHDTGAGSSTGQDVGAELRRLVDQILAQKEAERGRPISLTVGHGHSHGDHVHGDSAFADRPHTRVVGLSPAEVTAAYGIQPGWPDGEGRVDLGGRVLSVIPVPGHEAASVAFYDHASQDLLSGDSLYPGNIFVNGEWSEHRASVRRLARFVERNPVRMVLGSHIEMTRYPDQDYPYGTSHQPEEHSLVLRGSHLREMDTYLQATPSEPTERRVFHDFIVAP